MKRAAFVKDSEAFIRSFDGSAWIPKNRKRKGLDSTERADSSGTIYLPFKSFPCVWTPNLGPTTNGRERVFELGGRESFCSQKRFLKNDL